MFMNHAARVIPIALCTLLLLAGGCNLGKPRPRTPTPAPPASPSVTPSPLPTGTPTPSPTPTPIQPILTPAAGPPQFGRMEDAPSYLSSPGSVTIMVDPQPLLWSNAWCAADKDTLAANLAEIDWKFSLDGQPVPLDQFTPATYKDDTSAQECQRYSLLLEAWPPGRHTLQRSLILRQALNDGAGDFPAGEQSHTDVIYVADPSVPPPADPQAWLTIVSETFDPPSLTWQTGSLNDEWFTGEAEIKDGSYVLDMREVYQNTVFRHPPAVKVLSGVFQVSVNARRLDETPNEACYGLYFHYNYAGGEFYQWTVCEDRHYAIEIYNDDAWDTLVPWTEEKAIIPGEENRLTARLEGSHMTFTINDKIVAGIEDERLYGGYTGILAQAAKGSSARFAFDDFLLEIQ